jgi:hypothetical protein
MTKERELLKAIDREAECLPAHLADALQEVLSQPEQEPVAWMYEVTDDFELALDRTVERIYRDSKEAGLLGYNILSETALYTSPQTREPLSDEQCM